MKDDASSENLNLLGPSQRGEEVLSSLLLHEFVDELFHEVVNHTTENTHNDIFHNFLGGIIFFLEDYLTTIFILIIYIVTLAVLFKIFEVFCEILIGSTNFKSISELCVLIRCYWIG